MHGRSGAVPNVKGYKKMKKPAKDKFWKRASKPPFRGSVTIVRDVAYWKAITGQH